MGEEQQKLHMELVAQQRRIYNYCSPDNSKLHIVAKVLANNQRYITRHANIPSITNIYISNKEGLPLKNKKWKSFKIMIII